MDMNKVGEAVMDSMVEIQSKKEKYIKQQISENCSWWQKIYVNIATKFKWRIWFIEVSEEAPSITSNRDAYSVSQVFKVKINGKRMPGVRGIMCNDDKIKPEIVGVQFELVDYPEGEPKYIPLSPGEIPSKIDSYIN